MNLTLDEIATHRARLRQEIMERECLLAAFDVVEKYAANGHHPDSLQLSGMVSSLLPSRLLDQVKEVPTPASPAPASLPPPPPVERYVHPELKDERCWSNASLVRWAIQRMTHDYTSHDIAELLKREGRSLFTSDISTVLCRMKLRGEIEEIKRGEGPHPAIIRCPNSRNDEPRGVTAGPGESIASLLGQGSDHVG